MIVFEIVGVCVILLVAATRADRRNDAAERKMIRDEIREQAWAEVERVEFLYPK